MKSIIVISMLTAILSSCVINPKTIVTEYDQKGHKTKTTETPALATISANLAQKTVVIASNGWGLDLDVSAASTEGLMPGFSLRAGNLHHVIATIPSAATNLDKVADVVSASEMNLTISPTTGVTSSAAAR